MDSANIGDSSKRNGKEVVEATETPYVSTELCLGIGSSASTMQTNNVKANAWTDLLLLNASLNGVEPPQHLPASVLQKNGLGQCISNVKMAVKRWREADAQLQEAEERAAKRRREEEDELWNAVVALREENEALRKRVAELEQHEEEEGESSCGDSSGLEPLLLKCRVCARRRVAVMLWPCRHFCVCQVCDLTLITCPVCNVIKTGIFNVKLPR